MAFQRQYRSRGLQLQGRKSLSTPCKSTALQWAQRPSRQPHLPPKFAMPRCSDRHGDARLASAGRSCVQHGERYPHAPQIQRSARQIQPQLRCRGLDVPERQSLDTSLCTRRFRLQWRVPGNGPRSPAFVLRSSCLDQRYRALDEVGGSGRRRARFLVLPSHGRVLKVRYGRVCELHRQKRGICDWPCFRRRKRLQD